LVGSKLIDDLWLVGVLLLVFPLIFTIVFLVFLSILFSDALVVTRV
tara:strand:- start:221 stop:358 length:138 start_codon:yes stop_codon:yes gene_type:complete